MSDNAPDAQTWIGGILFLALAAMICYTLPPETRTDEAPLLDQGPPKEMARAGGAAQSVRQAPVPSRPTETAFAPPPESAVPDNEFGRMVRLGERIFQDTQANAKEFVGNDLEPVSKSGVGYAAGVTL